MRYMMHEQGELRREGGDTETSLRETGNHMDEKLMLKAGKEMRNAAYMHGVGGREYVHESGGELMSGMNPMCMKRRK